jgi:two-component system response regulator FixJ
MNRVDTVFVVDDEASVREGLRLLLEAEGFRVAAYASARDMLDAVDPQCRGCVILDLDMPDMDGMALQQALSARDIELPVIFLTAKGDIQTAVQAMKEGAVDFLEKPATAEKILERISAAIGEDARRRSTEPHVLETRQRYERLTAREREVMVLVVCGLANKLVARRLDISVRTAEGHRFRVMEKMQAASLEQLVAMAQAIGILDRREAQYP